MTRRTARRRRTLFAFFDSAQRREAIATGGMGASAPIIDFPQKFFFDFKLNQDPLKKFSIAIKTRPINFHT
jgi:hypothetical protein